MNYLEKAVTKKAAERTGKALPHEVPEVIKRDSFDPNTVEVMEHFGLNAASFLNTYSCRVEDALIEIASKCKEHKESIVLLYQEVLRLRELMPEDILAQYDAENLREE